MYLEGTKTLLMLVDLLAGRSARLSGSGCSVRKDASQRLTRMFGGGRARDFVLISLTSMALSRTNSWPLSSIAILKRESLRLHLPAICFRFMQIVFWLAHERLGV